MILGKFQCFYCSCFQVITLDLSTVVPSLSGPKRPHDRVAGKFWDFFNLKTMLNLPFFQSLT